MVGFILLFVVVLGIFGPILPDVIRAFKWWLRELWEAIKS